MDRWGFLTSQENNLDAVLKQLEFDARDLQEWLSDVMASRKLLKSEVVRESRLNQTFAYQILAGSRRASRDKLIQLAFGLRLNASDACEMLERAGLSALRTNYLRDAVIAYCLQARLGLAACDDILWDMGEATFISPRGNKRLKGSS